MIDEKLSYPIGRYGEGQVLDGSARESGLSDIEILPRSLRAVFANLSDEHLETPYREGGWTARQVIHHIADSHINSFVRFSLALTEETPEIRPYAEDKWAELPDHAMDPEVSLGLIEGIHARWVGLLRSISIDQFERKLVHPESGIWNLNGFIALYAWHGKHHLAHLEIISRSKTPNEF
ncbi:MAG: putative metal-dependent hydrolase [Pyrinomonadaceae bacterium]